MKVEKITTIKKFQPITIKITFENRGEFDAFHSLIGKSPSSIVTDSIYELTDKIQESLG
mgnify:CR=1 FL=1